MKILIISSLIVTSFLLSGCGEETTAEKTPSASLSSAYNLRSLATLETTINLTGEDSNGGNWSGLTSSPNRGIDYYNGYEFKLRETYVQLQEVGSGYSSSDISKSYLNENDIPYYMVSASGLVCELTNDASALPTNAQIGDFGEAGSYTCSDGSEIKSNWQLTSDKGNAVYIFTMNSSVNGSIIYTNKSKLLLDGNGSPMKVELLYFYPDSGVKLTLKGNVE